MQKKPQPPLASQPVPFSVSLGLEKDSESQFFVGVFRSDLSSARQMMTLHETKLRRS